MAKEEQVQRFGPEQWVTLRETGEYVKVEAFSPIAAAYRLRSRKNGMLFATDAELDTVPVHPEDHIGKHWQRCQAAGCGAPLTPSLPVCERCTKPICTCGRCQCARPTAASRAAAKTPRKKAKVSAR